MGRFFLFFFISSFLSGNLVCFATEHSKLSCRHTFAEVDLDQEVKLLAQYYVKEVVNKPATAPEATRKFHRELSMLRSRLDLEQFARVYEKLQKAIDAEKSRTNSDTKQNEIMDRLKNVYSVVFTGTKAIEHHANDPKLIDEFGNVFTTTNPNGGDIKWSYRFSKPHPIDGVRPPESNSFYKFGSDRIMQGFFPDLRFYSHVLKPEHLIDERLEYYFDDPHDLTKSFKFPKIFLNGSLITPDGKRIFWGLNGALFAMDPLGDKPLFQLSGLDNKDPSLGHTTSVLGAIHVNKKQLISWDYDNRILLWDLENPQMKPVSFDSSKVSAASSPDFNIIKYDKSRSLIRFGNELVLWNLETLKTEKHITIKGHTSRLLAFDTMYLSSSSELMLMDSKRVFFVDLNSGNLTGVRFEIGDKYSKFKKIVPVNESIFVSIHQYNEIVFWHKDTPEKSFPFLQFEPPESDKTPEIINDHNSLLDIRVSKEGKVYVSQLASYEWSKGLYKFYEIPVVIRSLNDL